MMTYRQALKAAAIAVPTAWRRLPETISDLPQTEVRELPGWLWAFFLQLLVPFTFPLIPLWALLFLADARKTERENARLEAAWQKEIDS